MVTLLQVAPSNFRKNRVWDNIIRIWVTVQLIVFFQQSKGQVLKAILSRSMVFGRGTELLAPGHLNIYIHFARVNVFRVGIPRAVQS